VRAVRVSRAIRSSAGGLAAGYVASLAGALWIRWAVPGGDLISDVVSPLRVAGFILTSAHGVPLVVQSAAGLQAPGAPGSVGSLNQILGGGEGVVFSFSVLLIPISILAISGICVALLVRRARPASSREVLVWSAISALVYGIGLGLVAKLASVVFEITARLAPDLGLGAATGNVVLRLGPRPLLALVIGAVWGAAFAAAGGMSAMPMRRSISPEARVVLLGWMRGLGTAAGTFAVLMALGGIGAVVAGRAPNAALIGLGGYLLAANAVAAAIVLAHGTSMAIALDAGPFTGWERMDFLHVGVAGTAAPAALWLLALVPVAAGVVAGRFVRRRSSLPPPAIAVRFGALWGLTLALLTLLLRVRVLSSFSVGSLDLGGGSAAFDPLIALALGFVWGTVSAFLGAQLTRPAHAGEEIWTCPSCGISNTDDDRFCVSCGAGREVPAFRPGASPGRGPSTDR
jgi:hypothetical protein